MALDERAFFSDRPETRAGRYQCPKCHRTNEYSIRWVRRSRKDRLPAGADEADRAKFAKLRDYLLRLDEDVTCKTCGKKFEIPSQHSLVFVDQLEGLPNDEVLAAFLRMWRSVLTRSDFSAGCSVLAVTVAPSSPELLDRAAAVFRAWRGRLAALLESGGLPADAARRFATTIVAASEGAVVLSRAEQSMDAFDLVSEELREERGLRLQVCERLLAFEERERRTEGAKLLARKMDERAGELLRRYETELEAVRRTATEEREKLRAEGQKLEAQILAEARADAAKLVERGKANLEVERQKLRVELTTQASQIATDIASRVLGREVV